MARVNVKAKIILSAPLIAFLFFMPLMFACNGNNGSTPPELPPAPSDPTLNNTAKEKLLEFYNQDFFPFNKVTVLEIADNNSSSEFRFAFSCENIILVKADLSSNLNSLGFTETFADGFKKESEGITINFKIIDNENNFAFVGTKKYNLLPENKTDLEIEIGAILGLEFDLGDFASSAVSVEKEDNQISFLFSNAGFNEACEVIKANFTGSNFTIVQTDFMLTIYLESDSSVITLTLANGEDDLAFNVTKG